MTKKKIGQYLCYPDLTNNRIIEGGLRTHGQLKKSTVQQPLVTIITVCLNSDKTLEQCISSVLNQTYQNIEYIIIDGLSQDKTLNIIKNYQNNIDYFISEPDSGLYQAMNKGLQLANGDYILILNSDDWYIDNCVELLVQAVHYSSANFVAGLAQYVNSEGHLLHVLRHMPYDASLYLRMPLRHETMLISAEIYNEIGLYNEEYHIIADYDLTVRLFDAGYTLYEIQKPLLYFRNDGISNTDKSKLFNERLQLISKKFNFLEKKDLALFSELPKLTIQHLEILNQKYLNQKTFINSLFQYYQDRVTIDKTWKQAHFNFTKPQNSPLISVILPIFNADDTLSKCIDSILSQTLNDFELICINDQSSDQSENIMIDYTAKDNRICSFVNKNNIGHGASRNKGIFLAKGSYIFHIDPDDIIPPKALENLYKNAIKYDSDLVKGAYTKNQLIHGKGAGKPQYMSLTKNSTIVNTSLKKMPQLLNTTEGHWSYLYKKELAKSISYPNNLKMGQDSIFIIELLIAAQKITIIKEISYNYCYNTASAMNTFNFRKFIDALEWRRRAWHILHNAGFTQLSTYFLQSYWSDDFFKNLVLTVNSKELNIFFNQFRQAFKEAQLKTANPKSSPLLSKLIRLIYNKENNQAYEHLMSYAKQSKIEHISFNMSNNHALKIATLSTFDFGGAGTGSQRRVNALRIQGIDAKIYSLRSQTKYNYVLNIPVKNSTNIWQDIEKIAVLNKKSVPELSANELFSLTPAILPSQDLSNAIKQADIIHLHWVVGMINYHDFDKIVDQRPIVWTLADMNAFTGGCHYSEGCDEYKNQCQTCHLLGTKSSIAHKEWQIKERLYKKLDNLHIICPSQWLANAARESSLFKNKPIYVISNPVPIQQFHFINKTVARTKLNLPLDKKLILFGADDLTNHRKGGDLLKETINILTKVSTFDCHALFFGRNKIDIDLPAHFFGRIDSEEKLSLIYSAADIFVFPSREDNSPLTVSESLLCGTPVISFPVGNIPDIIIHKQTGYIADYLNVNSLVDGILWGLNVKKQIKNSIQCRLSIAKIHDPVLSAKRHIQLYKSIINHNIFITTPCFNVEKTIDETIKSVISQAGNFTIYYHIQDGGSTDKTLEKLKYWEKMLNQQNDLIACNKVYFSWKSKPDNGMYDAIQRGFDYLNIEQNDFMTWINGDDLLLPDTLNKIIKISKNKPKIDWIGSHTHNITENGKINTSKPNPTPTIVIKEGLCDGMKNHWLHLQQEGSFFKKWLWDKSKLILPKYKLAGDWALWQTFAQHTEYYQFDKPLGAFRIRQGQLSARLRDKYDAEISLTFSIDKRNKVFNQLYHMRQELYANVISISPTGDIIHTKEKQFVRDYFYKIKPFVQN